jgi:hypothetical protein
MRFWLLYGFTLVFYGVQAQDVSVYGNYYIGVPGEENAVTLEQNCWTMEIDEVILGAADYEEYEIELIFNGFHSANLMGKVLESSSTGMRFSVHDPDMEDAPYETYSFIRLSDGRCMLLNEASELGNILVPTSDKDKYTYIPCREETPVHNSEGEE